MDDTAGVGGEPFWRSGMVAFANRHGGRIGRRRGHGKLDSSALALRLEHRGNWRRGALTTVLTDPVATTSTSLHEAASAARATEVAGRGAAALAKDVSHERTGIARLAVCAGVGLLMLVLARPADGAARLWKPWHAWSALTAPYNWFPGDDGVARRIGTIRKLPSVSPCDAVLRAPAKLARKRSNWVTAVVPS